MKNSFTAYFFFCLCLFLITGCAKHASVPADEAIEAEDEEYSSNFPQEDFSVFSSEEDYRMPDITQSRRSRRAGQKRTYDSGDDKISNKKYIDKKTGQMLVNLAKTTIGTPYVFGGSSRSGFDCSGLVRWTYSHFGINLPRSASEQAHTGRAVRNGEALQAGDLVMFRHPKRGYHVGIYVGDGKFIHSPRRNKNVTIVSLDEDYFRNIYIGARRLDGDVDNDRLEQVEDIVNDYKADLQRRRSLGKDRTHRRNHSATRRSDRNRRQQSHGNISRQKKRDNEKKAKGNNQTRQPRDARQQRNARTGEQRKRNQASKPDLKKEKQRTNSRKRDARKPDKTPEKRRK